MSTCSKPPATQAFVTSPHRQVATTLQTSPDTIPAEATSNSTEMVDTSPARQRRFETTIQTNRDRLLRVACRILRDADLSEDAVQEAFIQLWREANWPSNLEVWLTRTVVHRSLHLRRTAIRRGRHESRAGNQSHPRSNHWGPDEPVLAREMADAVHAALDQLPTGYRDVFILRVDHEQEYETIAHRLDIPVGTVRSRLNRCRKALQNALGDLLTDQPSNAGMALTT